MKILIIDNYDSFTYNLYQYTSVVLIDKGDKYILDVIRNDELSFEEIENRNYDKIIISPGPGDPSDSEYFGVCSKVIVKLGKITPIFGVCLGMQGICHYFGGRVIKASKIMHGKTSPIKHSDTGVFKDLPKDMEVMRYHSLMADKNSLPANLEITAITTDDNTIMGLKHKEYPVEGVQFHPESFATEAGKQILRNFLE